MSATSITDVRDLDTGGAANGPSPNRLGGRAPPSGLAQAGDGAVRDLKGSSDLLADRDHEEARQLLDPVLERMMEAVHHNECTLSQVMGDGIMALVGARCPP